MSTLQALTTTLTLYQIFSLICISAFTIAELRRWSKYDEMHSKFGSWFTVRCIVMISAFAVLKPLPTLLLSYFTMVCVSGFGGSFYLPGPNEKPPMVWVKYKTLGIPIPRDVLNQTLLWFVIDIFAYLFWLVLIPYFLSYIVKDTVIMERVL